MNRHIKKISNYAIVGSMGALVIASLTGCGDNPQDNKPEEQAQNQGIKKEGATVTIQETINKDTNKSTYKIIDEIPSATTRVILRDANGTERILTQAEIDKLVKEEEKRVENGTSALTKSPEEVKDSGGLGLAGTLMASMAGGMLGGYLMNKLMNNQNYQQNRRMSYSPHRSTPVLKVALEKGSKVDGLVEGVEFHLPKTPSFFKQSAGKGLGGIESFNHQV